MASILASSMAFIDGSALNVALPVLQQELQATGTDLLWILNGYLLMLASLLLVSGSLGDMVGRKRVFNIGIIIFVLASVGCGFAPNTRILIAARVIQGIGGAIMTPGSLSLISALFPVEIRGQAIGTWSAAAALVTVAGPAIGGILADNGLWRGLFFINVPLGILALYALTKVPESYDKEAAEKSIDYFGAALTTIGLGGITYGFITMSDSGSSSPTVWLSLVIGFGALGLFVWWQNKTAEPMIPLHIFQSSTFSATNLLTLFLYAALQTFSLFFSLNMVQIQGYSPTVAGFAFLPFALMIVLLSRWAGALADRIGPRPLLTIGPAIAGIGFLWLSFIGLNEQPSDIWITFVPGLILFGFGMSLTVAPLTAGVMTALPDQFSGVASGVNNAVARTAGVLGIAIIGALGISLFGSQLATITAESTLPAAMRTELLTGANQLAETPIPATATGEQERVITDSIKLAFIYMHQIVMRICAGLAFVSALIAYLFIDKRPVQSDSASSYTTIAH